ncbi:MAG: ABC transporter permease [Bacteroidales bacterium]|jgi:ABC-2 type transport system permease protein|nr:ABC transporter permease [Bacteroidales bacterium]
MKKTLIIIRREFLTRVRKKSFLIMTLLGPVLFAGMILAPVWLASVEDDGVKRIAVLDSSQLFIHKIPETATYRFTYVADVKPEDFKKNLSQTEFFGILYIPPYIAYVPSGAEFFSYRQPPASLIMHAANAIEKEIENEKLKAHHIENLDDILRSVRTRIDIRTFQLSDGGGEKEHHRGLNTGVAYASAFLIYLFVLLFGSQVMRGVIEEKTSRIVEVIISSVKPFQLMMGKVIGVALTGLTQFAIWVAFTLLLVATAQHVFLPDTVQMALQQGGEAIGSSGGMQNSEIAGKTGEIFAMLRSINFGVLLGCFLFFFIGGFLLYASLFAAIGSAVDTEADTQQFVLPVTIPLIIALMSMFTALQDPDGMMAFWFSMIPFTSPIVMMARIPFGVPYGEVLLSMVLLVAAFTGAIWLSAKIYRTGILMYGKKPTYAELWKWIKYKNK